MESILNFFSENFSGLTWLAVLFVSMLPIAEAKVAIPFAMSAEVWGINALSPFMAGLLSFIGSMLPAIFIILFLKPVFAYLKKTRMFKNIITYLENFFKSKSAHRHKHKVKVNVSSGKELVGDKNVSTEKALSFNVINNKDNYVINAFSGAKSKSSVTGKSEVGGLEKNVKKTKLSHVLALVFFTALPLPLAGVWTSSAIAAFSDVKFWPAFLAIAFGNLLEVIFITLLCTILIDSIFTVLIFSLDTT